jgi:type IV pilus assembly protein PilY1
MHSVKRLSALLVTAAAIAALVMPHTALADDSDIFGANIQPNVLILLDNSGSMDDVIDSIPYDDNTTYPVIQKCGSSKNQNCDTGVVYKAVSSNKYTVYATTVSQVNKSSARNALNNVGFWSGSISGSQVDLYLGNYLNYQIGFCSAVNCVGEKKIDIAKRVLKSLVDNVTGVRFGFMKFWNNDVQGSSCNSTGHCGGSMVAQMGTSASVMKAAIDAINPNGYTPLGEFMLDGGNYYKGAQLKNGNTYTSPIQTTVGQCQPNFIILVSDGLQNGYMDVRTEAGNRFAQDHSTLFANKQNVIVHTVGFALSAADKAAGANDILKTAAANGGGLYFETENSAQLEQALQKAIQSIMAATFTFATPVVPTTSTSGSTKLYLAAFLSDQSSPFWHGFLKAYQRDSNGLVPVYTTGTPDQIGKPINAPVWEAGSVLNGIAPGTRVIKTIPTTSVSLSVTGTNHTTTGTGTLQSFVKSNSALTYQMLGAADNTERDKTIDFLRGIDSTDEDNDGNTTEQRAWKLGDIFHSTPVLVTQPLLALNDSSYQSFKSAQAGRTKILIAGANDGMLHAFRESDGAEIWAFIPPDLLGGLHDLTAKSGEHLFFVDASPIAADIKVSGVWKTVVVFGLRRGGRHYYALDITDTTNPTFLWSFTDDRMAETWSEPAIGKVKIGTNDQYVMFVGGGYNTDKNNEGGKPTPTPPTAFFVIDLATGALVWSYDNTAGGDATYMNFSIAANPTAVDFDNNGYTDHVYIGDVGGQLWKFDVSQTSTSNWKGRRLFAAASGQTNPPAGGEYYPAQGFYAAPTLAFDSSNHVWVYIGSGDRNHPNNTSSNRFYGIRDADVTYANGMSQGATVTESQLADVSTATGSNTTDTDGWFFQLGANEKAFAASNVFNNTVLFSGFTPATTVTCEGGGGDARLYAVQMTTGYAAMNFSTGQALTTTDHTVAKSAQIGTGIASMPVVIVNPPAGSGSASASAITATTNQQLPNNPVPSPGFLKQVRSWREQVR